MSRAFPASIGWDGTSQDSRPFSRFDELKASSRFVKRPVSPLVPDGTCHNNTTTRKRHDQAFVLAYDVLHSREVFCDVGEVCCRWQTQEQGS